MLTALKLLPSSAKLGLLVTFLIAIGLTIASSSYISYNKGLNVSKIEVERYQKDKAQLQVKLKEAEGKITTKVVTEYVTKVVTQKQIQYRNRDIVKTIVPEQFNLSRGWIYAYNQSVQGLEIDPELAKDPTPSTVSEMTALADTIIPNNQKALTIAERLNSLQIWVKEQEEARVQITR